MARVRVSIAGLMGLVAVFSLLWASTRYASGVCADLVFTATLGVFGVAMLGAFFKVGEARVRWAGFALLGGGYLLVCYGPGFGSEFRWHLTTSALLDQIGPRIVHPRVLTYKTMGRDRARVIESVLAAPEDLDPVPPNNVPVITAFYGGWPGYTISRLVGTGDPEDFQRIGHCWLALGLGLVGGTIARKFRASGGESG